MRQGRIEKGKKQAGGAGPMPDCVFFLGVYSVLAVGHCGIWACDCVAALPLGPKEVAAAAISLAYLAASLWHLGQCLNWGRFGESDQFDNEDDD